MGEFNDLDILSCLRYESSSDLLGINSDSVVGRLNKSFQFWRDILQAKDFVLDIVSNGYKLPLFRYPLRCFIKNNKSALEHEGFVEQAINKLLQVQSGFCSKYQLKRSKK